MNTFLEVFMSMSLSGALLILVLLAGKRFWQDKLSRQWQYYIWIIVIWRLLVPFAPEFNLMETARQTVESIMHSNAPSARPQTLWNRSADMDIDASRLMQGKEQTGSAVQSMPSQKPASRKAMMLNNWIDRLKNSMLLLCRQFWLIWLIAVSGLLIRKITMYQSFVRYIKAGNIPVADTEMLDRFSAVAKQAGIKGTIELCVNSQVASPMLMGFFRPCVILPSTNLSETAFYYIVLHELTHCKRLDILYKWLVQITVCLHWFNPMVYLMRRELAKACEFSCDAAVLARVGDIHAPKYGKTLLDAMAAVRKYKEAFGAVTLSQNKQLLKERLCAVMKYQKKSKKARLLTGALTLGIVLGTALVGVYPAAAAESDQKLRQSSGGNYILQSGETQTSSFDKEVQDTFAAQIDQYYEEGNLPLFQIAFSRLDERAKSAWIERIYTDGQISFLGLVVNQLPVDSAEVQHCAERAYADRSVALFSIAAKRMSEKTLKGWLDRALADEQFVFQSVLFELLDDDRLDALEEELDREFTKKQMQEYLEHGIQGDGEKTFYYESQLVHIFLDIRKEGSFYFLQVNPQGTVNVKVTRDENGAIKSVGYMTEAEVEELFGDMEDETCIGEMGGADEGVVDETKYGIPQIIAVNEQYIDAGEKLWFGDYELRSGDRLRYDIEVETGDAIAVGFISNDKGSSPNVFYHSALVHRTDGVLECTAEFIRGEAAKDGNYKLCIYAPEGALGNVKGSVSIIHAQ